MLRIRLDFANYKNHSQIEREYINSASTDTHTHM